MSAKSNTELNKKKEKEYFIAIIPPQPIYDQAWTLKNYFNDHFQSKAALNSPPHVTLHMPFKWKEENEQELIQRIEIFTKSFSSQDIQLMDFNAFPPRVIFIGVIRSEWLTNLQRELQRFCKKELNLFNANYKEHPFHPHLTLAFRDLKKQNFTAAWEEFKDRKFESTFTVNSIVLLKHDGKAWQPHTNFKLGN